MPAVRCRILMKWMSAWASMRWLPIACGRRWGSIRRQRCTMCAGASDTPMDSTSLSGSSKSPAPCLPRTSTRLQGSRQRAPAFHVLPPRRRNIEGRLQTGRSGLEPRLCREGQLNVDLGRATAISLPEAETQTPLERSYAAMAGHACASAWRRPEPVHGAPSVQPCNVAYAPTSEEADRALAAKATMFHEMGLQVHLCGVEL